LPHLPVPVVLRSRQCFIDFRSFEGRQGQYGSAPHRGLVAGGGEDGLETPWVADRSEGSDRGLPHQRIFVVGRQSHEAIDSGTPRSLIETGELTTCPRGSFDNVVIRVVEQREHRCPRARGIRGSSRFRNAPTHDRVDVFGSALEIGGCQLSGARQCTERRGPDAAVFVSESRTNGGHVAVMTGECDVSPSLDAGLGTPHHSTAFFRPVRIRAPPSKRRSARRAPISARSVLNKTTARTRTHQGVGVTASGLTTRAACCLRSNLIRGKSRSRPAWSVAGWGAPFITTRPAIASAAPMTTRPMTNLNTPSTIVTGARPTPQADEERRRRQWLRRWWWVIAIATMMSLLTTAFVVTLLVHVPYVIESPGNAESVDALITVPPDRNNPTSDHINLVTVTVNTDVTVFDKWRAEHSSDETIVPAKQVLGTQTPQENNRLNQVLMRQSKDAAVLVALGKLGYHVTPTPTGALIVTTDHGAPAAGVLQVGDTIVAVDGQPVTSRDQLVQAVGARKPGDQVTLGIEDPNGNPRDTSVTLTNHPDKPGAGFLGVAADDRLDYPSLPFDVSIDSQRIGGPSAGLAFTLGLLDELTPGDLTGGQEVAATGTISPDGTVGEIGGVEQKVTTVHRAHIPYFLVPAGDAAAAQKNAPSDVKIVPIHTLDEALAFLGSLGGSGLPAPVG
jgi:Lon-like protease